MYYLPLDDISVENDHAYNIIKNNSIVNSFPLDDSKRNLDYESHDFLATCTTVQGNHDPLWKVEFFDSPGETVIIDELDDEDLYISLTNSYELRLNAFVSDAISGEYRCESSITGIFIKFIVTIGMLHCVFQTFCIDYNYRICGNIEGGKY